MINSCSNKNPQLQLIHSTEINFPSASAIEFYNNKLYVFGDDARNMLVLSPTYSIIDSIAIIDSGSYRIDKKDKHDIESAMIVVENNKPHLFGVGSMSDKKRWNVIGYDLQAGTVYNTAFFDTSKDFNNIEAINVEGSCVVEPYIVFANRANLSNPNNHLLFWNKQDSVRTKLLQLPSAKKIRGVSGLFYLKEKDLLLLTASEEETASTTADGEIGESYLGWIRNFSKKINDAVFKPDEFFSLIEIDKAFSKQKVESVCFEKRDSDRLILHMVADNDNGRSRLFNLSLKL